MIDYNIIYNNIKELCKKQGVTIAQFERILNFGEGSISKWRSSYPSIYRVFYVAEYFNVSIDYLVGRTQITSLSDDILNDPDIILIQIARQRLSKDDQNRMLSLLKLTFEHAFNNSN